MKSLSYVARRNLLIVAMFAIVIGSWLLLDREREAADREVETVKAPDSYFTGMELTRFGDDGRPEMTLRAASALHYPDDPDIHLEMVEARSSDAGTEWQLTADTGRLARQDNRMNLRDTVRLVRRREAGQPIVLATEQLQFDADREILQTDAPVSITHGKSRIDGNSLWASLAEDHFIIESGVSARYEN